MQRLILPAVCIAILAAATAFFLLQERPANRPAETQSEISSGWQSAPPQSSNGDQGETLPLSVRLACPDTPFQGEVVFVTDTSRPQRIEIETVSQPEPPVGYPLAPTRVNTQWSAQEGRIEETGESAACWYPPEREGVLTVTVEREAVYEPFSTRKPTRVYRGRAAIRFLVPRVVERIVGGKINGFPVGQYPNPDDPRDLAAASTPNRIRRHQEAYQPPIYWYRVDESTKDLMITRDYRLGDFDLDPRFRPMPYPHYIAIDPNVLLKLDALKKRMNRDGYGIKRFDLIYGFRSPYYNLSEYEKDGETSLKSSFSVHMYGKACDIVVDRDGDLVMDDLNKDGTIDIHDAEVILAYVNEMDHEYIRKGSPLVGGAGVYPHHDFWERGEVAQSPYIHIDVRGFADEQGLPIRWRGKNTLAEHKRLSSVQ